MSEIRFELSAAERLLSEMDVCCTGIQKEARDILSILKSEDIWNDRQTKAFQMNMHEIAKDLNQTLQYNSEFMRIYYQKIQELRG